MKCILLLAAFLGLMALASVAQAYPQRVYVQKLPYYPPPTRPPRPIRVRRELKLEEAPAQPKLTIEDTVATNPKGGLDVSLKATKVFENDDARAIGSVFVAGNTNGGGVLRGATIGAASLDNSGNPSKSLSVSVQKAQDSIRESFTKQAEANLKLGDMNSLTGKISQTDTKIKGIDFRPQQTSGSLAWKNDHGFGASISRDIDRGVSDTLTKSVSANIFERGDHRLDGTLFKSNVVQDNGFKFDKTGGILDYSHNNGHGLSAGLTRFSGIGQQASLSGHTNLFTSNDGLTKLNANAGASKWLNGPYTSQRDYNFGLGLSYNGWRG